MENVILAILLIKYFWKWIDNSLHHLWLSGNGEMFEQLSDTLIDHQIVEINQLEKLISNLYLHVIITTNENANVWKAKSRNIIMQELCNRERIFF